MAEGEPNPLVVFATIAAVISSVIALYFVQQRRKSQPVLDKDLFKKFPLIEKTRISHNTCIYRFGLPKSTDRLGLPIGQHISIGATIDGKEVLRSYTPISTDDQTGYFDLLIKVYEQGLITNHIDSKKVGETINVRGPKGFFNYTPNMVKSFGMIAGGTGITPMYQIITAILSNPEDKTKIHLLFGNVTENDILLKPELEKLQREHPDQLFIQHVLNSPPDNWTGHSGFITAELVEKYLPKATDETKLLMCGPPPMVSGLKKAVIALGYPKAKPVSKINDQVFIF